jgi:hypothetical protein
VAEDEPEFELFEPASASASASATSIIWCWRRQQSLTRNNFETSRLERIAHFKRCLCIQSSGITFQNYKKHVVA